MKSNRLMHVFKKILNEGEGVNNLFKEGGDLKKK